MERIGLVGSGKNVLAELQACARCPVEFVKAAPTGAAVLQRAAFQAVGAMLRSKHTKVRAAGWESVGKGSLGSSTGIVELATEAAALFVGRDHSVVLEALNVCLALITVKTTDEAPVKRALYCGALPRFSDSRARAAVA